MRLAFLFAILLVGAAYAWVAFAQLHFLGVTGRLGPGFFPRLIGAGLIATCLLCIPFDLRRMRHDDIASAHWGTVATVIALSAGLVALFMLLGGTVGMALFLLVTLSILNRGHVVQNVLVALLLPAGIYYLFDVWLNASMPEGLLALPI